MKLPNVIGIGAQRAATTWMFHCLKDHPQVFTPEKKELHYFDENYDKGIEWYSSHFENADRDVIVEVTPNYLNVPEAIPRMAETLPEAKIFVVFREPVARAYSSYKLLKNEHYQTKSFEEACKSSPYLLRLSTYAEDLQRAYDLFGKDRVAVFFYDDIKNNPREIIRQLYDFIGVDSEFVPPSIDIVYNPILFPRFQAKLESIGLSKPIESFKRSPLGRSLKNFLANRQLRPVEQRSSKPDKTITSPEYHEYLKDYFRDDIKRLEALTGRDLSSWY